MIVIVMHFVCVELHSIACCIFPQTLRCVSIMVVC